MSTSPMLAERRRPLDFVARAYSDLTVILLIPVSITIFAVVWGVENLTPLYAGKDESPLFLVASEGGEGQSAGKKLEASIYNALLVIAMIFAATVLIVILYKLRCMKAIVAWLLISSAMIFFFLFWVWIDLVATRYQIPYDLVTAVIVLWNFGVVGIISVFYYAHPKLGQGYLVVLSVIMAWFLSRLPEWTTWAILIAVAIYDILVVLCPRGPLKVLVEESKKRDEPIPGFVYDSTSEAVHYPDDDHRDRGGNPAWRSDAASTTATTTTTPLPTLVVAECNVRPQQQQPPPFPSSAAGGAAAGRGRGGGGEEEESRDGAANPLRDAAARSNAAEPPSAAAAARGGTGSSEVATGSAPAAAAAGGGGAGGGGGGGGVGEQEEQEEQEEEEEEEPDPFDAAHLASPFRLGLGDFIFYSVLVARAAYFSYVSWMTCYICVSTGLIGTLASLLFLRGRVPALPALPISIFLGVIGFFLSRFVTVPFAYFFVTTGAFL